MPYEPTWAWDQSRPEAIEARRQVEEFHVAICAAWRDRQAAQGPLDLSGNSLTKHFRLAVGHLAAGLRKSGLGRSISSISAMNICHS